jgi:hypothetical protein
VLLVQLSCSKGHIGHSVEGKGYSKCTYPARRSMKNPAICSSQSHRTTPAMSGRTDPFPNTREPKLKERYRACETCARDATCALCRRLTCALRHPHLRSSTRVFLFEGSELLRNQSCAGCTSLIDCFTQRLTAKGIVKSNLEPVQITLDEPHSNCELGCARFSVRSLRSPGLMILFD